jgi:hypothetical protein
MLDKYEESELVGGTMDAFGKVGQFAQSKLPEWITRNVLKNANLFDFEVLVQETSIDPMVMHLMHLPFMVDMCTMPMKW